MNAQPSSEIHKQFNVIVTSESENTFELIYEIKSRKDENSDIKIYQTESQDSFILHLIGDIKSFPKNKSQILFHIHGMWGSRKSNFINAYGLLYEYLILPEESDMARILSIKWPGNKPEYLTNKFKVIEIGDEMQKLFVQLIRKIQLADKFLFNFSTDFDLIGHSLAGELIKEIVKNIDEKELKYPLFNQVVIAAPDLDTDVLEKEGELQKLEYFANRSHIYFSHKDLTLSISKSLNKKGRLGLDGPTESSVVPKNVFFVDVTEVSDEENIGDKISGHAYYRASNLITADILKTLRGDKIESFPSRELIDKSLHIYKYKVKGIDQK